MEILGAIQTDFGKIQMASVNIEQNFQENQICTFCFVFSTFNVNYVNKNNPVKHVNAYLDKMCILK